MRMLFLLVLVLYLLPLAGVAIFATPISNRIGLLLITAPFVCFIGVLFVFFHETLLHTLQRRHRM